MNCSKVQEYLRVISCQFSVVSNNTFEQREMITELSPCKSGCLLVDGLTIFVSSIFAEFEIICRMQIGSGSLKPQPTAVSKYKWIINKWAPNLLLRDMPVKSLYPDPPLPGDSNIHHLLLNRRDQKGWPDYTLHIDAVTGQKRMYRDFRERVHDGATALGISVADGGLGLRAENGELVGILSENSMASWA
jgi:hypothetical protein